MKTISYEDALAKLADGLMAANRVNIGSFFDFVRDIWSQGYESPEYFYSWHIKVLCEDVQKTINEKKHYVAVLPRGHLKSTVLGHAFAVWSLLKAKSDSSILYMSYSHQMAEYHIKEIKNHIRNNPILDRMMHDRVPNADFSCRYIVNGRRVEAIPMGLFSAKRGMHTSGAIVVDDILRDPENPLNTTQLAKVEEWFSKEVMYIPNPGAPIICMGTPMAPDDLLAKLQDDERFNKRVLPVFNPTPDREVLAPEIRSKQWLLSEQKNNPKGFASEFMLSPYASTNAFLNDEDIQGVENDDLRSMDPNLMQEFDSDYTVAGFDIGKKRHPSHLVIFSSKENTLLITQIHSSFLDNWDYTDQAKYLNTVTRHFDIDRGYFDNTRAELEFGMENNLLTSVWTPIHFTQKQKRVLAQKFEEYVIHKKIKLIVDQRQRSQITCVDSDLKAPQTPLGHGDAFWSVALAVLAHDDYASKGTKEIGSLTDWIQAGDEASSKSGGLDFNQREEKEICPFCGQSAGWIPERKKCLICVWEHFNEMEQLEPSVSNFPKN